MADQRALSPRQIAQAAGEQFYETGLPCLRGNVAKRRTYSGKCVCVDCNKAVMAGSMESMRRWFAENPERLRDIKRKSAVKRIDFKREYNRRYKRENAAKVLADCRLRQTRKLQATPPWADLKSIEAIYAKAKEMARTHGGRWHVDHEIPLRGKNVCGLHVEANLRIVSAAVNMAKSNQFECA